MSRLNHTFSVEYAEKYGVQCAILIHHFQFWIEQNKAMERNFHDGRTWMYQSQKEISAAYPYWSEDSVFRTLKRLVEEGVLVKGNYNKTKFDQTAWYAFENEEMFTLPRNRRINTTKPLNQNHGTADPIPDTKPDTKQKQQQEPPAAAAFSSLIPKKESAKEVAIYQCLLDLPLTKDEMIQITRSNTEDRISEGVRLAKSKKKPPRNLGAFIVWAAADEIKAPISQEDNFRENQEFAKKTEKEVVAPKGIELEILSKHVEIVYTSCSKQPICLYYKDVNFKTDLQASLKTNKFRMKGER